MAKKKEEKAKYRSKFEESLANGPLKGVPYEPVQFRYTVIIQEERGYTPDFVVQKGLMIYFIEAKGRFRDKEEVRKYTFIRDSLPDNIKLIFLFQNPKGKAYGAKIRKDGSFRTLAEWAESEGFAWFTKDNIVEFVS